MNSTFFKTILSPLEFAGQLWMHGLQLFCAMTIFGHGPNSYLATFAPLPTFKTIMDIMKLACMALR